MGEINQYTMRKVSDSRTEQCYIVMSAHLNGAGKLFGGQLLSWIDMTAGIVGMRHSDHNVVTVAIDRIVFKESAQQGDVVTLIGEITYVGTSSMEVKVETYKENKGGHRYLINEAYVVMVAIDDVTGRPIPVPGIVIEGNEQLAKWEAGKNRAEDRKNRS